MMTPFKVKHFVNSDPIEFEKSINSFLERLDPLTHVEIEYSTVIIPKYTRPTYTALIKYKL